MVFKNGPGPGLLLEKPRSEDNHLFLLTILVGQNLSKVLKA
jgi:hypothetical protein